MFVFVEGLEMCEEYRNISAGLLARAGVDVDGDVDVWLSKVVWGLLLAACDRHVHIYLVCKLN